MAAVAVPMVVAGEAVSTAAVRVAVDHMLHLAADNTTRRQNQMAAVMVPTDAQMAGRELQDRAVQRWVLIPARAPARVVRMAWALTALRDRPHVPQYRTASGTDLEIPALPIAAAATMRWLQERLAQVHLAARATRVRCR